MSTAHALAVPTWTRGDRMRKSLRESPFGVKDAAVKFRVHRNTISNWLSDAHAPSPTELAEWAVWTKVPLSWLETGEEAPTDGGDGLRLLPHLDSNQEPTGYGSDWLRFRPEPVEFQIEHDEAA